MVDFIGFDPCDLESERRLLVNMSVNEILCRNLLTISQEIGKCPEEILSQNNSFIFTCY